jgi:hypothetical protein
MTDRKKPGWAFWAAVVLVALPVLYVLSFGPACWISSRLGHGGGLLPTIYRPLVATMRIGEEAKERQICAAYSWMVGRPERVPVVPEGRLAWFASLGAPIGWHWRYCAIYTIRRVTTDDLRIRLGDEAWEWSNSP